MGDDTSREYNVLFLCTGNTARSIMAEAILRDIGVGKFNAYSAGSQPAGTVNPFVIELLQRLDNPVEGLRSKSWDEFAGADAPQLDFVFTLCDSAANETCPTWPGQPMTAHWGIEDPAAVEGNDAEKALAFRNAYRMINNRVSLFVNLPIVSLDRLTLKQELDEIGRRGTEQPEADQA